MSKMEPYQPKVLLLFAPYIFLLLSCGAKLVHSYSPPLAVTFFISPGGSDSNPGTESQPFLTFTKAFSSMQGGDELVLLDGVYTPSTTGVIDWDAGPKSSNSIPSGLSLSAMTYIHAMNSGEVIVEGDLFIGRSSRKDSYIKIRGIIFKGHGQLYNTSYNTIKECFFSNGLTIGTNDHNNGNTHNLIEDVAVIASQRRIIANNYRADYNVWRRIVIRGDGCNTSSCTGSGNPNVRFTIYNSKFCSTQNVIIIDSLLGGGSRYADFATAQHSSATAETPLEANEWLGCISMNSEDSPFQMEADHSVAPSHHLENCVAVGNETPSSLTGINLGGDRESIVENCTVVFKTPTTSSLIRRYDNTVSPTTRNCIARGDAKYAIVRGGMTSYINTYGNFTESRFFSTTVSPGDIRNDPMNDGPIQSLKYPVRVEPGSALKGAGSGGKDIGANIIYKYGVDGTRYGEPGYNTLTSEPIWPWPNEDKIKSFMCAEAGVTRGFCAAETLTKYIWEYLGSPIPPEIYGAGVDNEPPSTPSAVTAAAISESQINLAWNASADNNGVAGYRVDVSTAPSFGSLLPGYNNKDLGNVTQAGITGLDPQTTYYARLRAYDFAQNLSADSATASATTPQPPPQQVTLQQNLNGYIGVKDTRVSFYDPNINFGNDTKMLILGGSENVKALVRFDLSSIPASAVISSATLSLYNYSHQPSINGGTVSVHPVTKPWAETQATWHIYSTGNSWAAAGMQAGGDYITGSQASIAIDTSINVWRNFDVTAMVQQWVNGAVANNGFVVRSSTYGVKPHFYSSNYLSDISLRPKLTVIYRLR